MIIRDEYRKDDPWQQTLGEPGHHGGGCTPTGEQRAAADRLYRATDAALRKYDNNPSLALADGFQVVIGPSDRYVHMISLERLFGAKVRRLSDGSDGTRNGVGASRELKIGPLPWFVETNTEVIPNELIRYRITKGGALKNHEGVMRFSRNGGGSRLDYTIDFDGKVPGTGPLIRAMLTRSVAAALKKYAAGGSSR